MTDLYRCDKCKGVFERQPSFEGYFRPCVMGKNPKVQLCDTCSHKMWKWLESSEPDKDPNSIVGHKPSIPGEDKGAETIVTTCGTCKWKYNEEWGLKVCHHPDNFNCSVSEGLVCKRWEGKE